MDNTIQGTELRIRELSNSVSTPKIRDSNQFISDIQKTLDSGTYSTRDEAVKGVLEYAQSKNVTYQGVDTNNILAEISSKPIEDKSLIDRFGETFDKRGKAGADILTRGAKGDTGAIEGGLLFGANFLGTLADLTGDVIAEGFTELDEFGDEGSMQKALMSGIEKVAETSGGRVAFNTLQEASNNLATLKELDPVKGARFQGALDTVNGILTLAGGTAGKEGIKQAGKITPEILNKAGGLTNKAVDKTKGVFTDIKGKIGSKKEDDLLKNLNLETVKGKIGDIEVDIPKPTSTITEKITAPFINKTEKELAGRAISPRTIGKNAKQKLKSIADVELNTKKLYDNIRTGKLTGSIDTLEDTAQTVVNNLDTVGARIGNAVKKVDGTIDIDNKLTDDIINALGTKGAEVSPATPLLKKFYDSLGNGKLSIDEAYELKKAYSNEVTKLYKGGDAGTKQYKALSDGVKFLNTKIDDIIDTKLGTQFADDKELFSSLKTIVDDLVASSLVEGRKSPNTLAEQIGMVESIFSPVNSAKQKLIQSVGEQNTRGGAWKTLIKKYDEASIKSFADVKVPVGLKALDNIKVNTKEGVEQATKLLKEGILVPTKESAKLGQIIKDFIIKHGEAFKEKLGELFDEIADRIPGVKNNFIKDTGKSLDDFGENVNPKMQSRLDKNKEKLLNVTDEGFSKQNLISEIDEIEKFRTIPDGAEMNLGGNIILVKRGDYIYPKDIKTGDALKKEGGLSFNENGSIRDNMGFTSYQDFKPNQ